MKTKGTGKAMRMKEEVDSTVIPGIKVTRTIANMEKNAKDGSIWKTDRLTAMRKAVRARYFINNDIMDSVFTKAFDMLLPYDLFTINNINSESFMEDYVAQYRRSFGKTPLKLKGLDTHSKQLMMFDSDIEYLLTVHKINKYLHNLDRVWSRPSFLGGGGVLGQTNLVNIFTLH